MEGKVSRARRKSNIIRNAIRVTQGLKGNFFFNNSSLMSLYFCDVVFDTDTIVIFLAPITTTLDLKWKQQELQIYRFLHPNQVNGVRMRAVGKCASYFFFSVAWKWLWILSRCHFQVMRQRYSVQRWLLRQLAEEKLLNDFASFCFTIMQDAFCFFFGFWLTLSQRDNLLNVKWADSDLRQ